MPGTSPGIADFPFAWTRRNGQAGAIAGRWTGFSTIGKLISADNTPNNTDSHHTAL
jgi:hypothetical protein